jgi:hypothetical protein
MNKSFLYPLLGGAVLACGQCPAIALAGPTETILYSFAGGTHQGNPQSELITDSTGNLYGTLSAGGGQ